MYVICMCITQRSQNSEAENRIKKIPYTKYNTAAHIESNGEKGKGRFGVVFILYIIQFKINSLTNSFDV